MGKKKENSDNLIPMSQRPKSRQKEITRKGGIQSGITRKKQREIKELMNFIDQQPLPEGLTPKKIINIKDPTIRDGIIITLYTKILLDGDMRALELYLKLKGEYPKDIELNNQSLTIIWNEKRYGIDQETE